MAFNVTIPVNDSEQRKRDLLEGVGLNKSTIDQCLSDTDEAMETEARAVLVATEPKQAVIVPRDAEEKAEYEAPRTGASDPDDSVDSRPWLRPIR